MTGFPRWPRAVAEPLVGLGPLRAIVGAYFAVTAITVVVTGVVESMSPAFWLGSTVALACYGTGLAVTLTPAPGRFGRSTAGLATALVVGGQCATLAGAAYDSTGLFDVYVPLAATAYVVYVMIVFRNHPLIVWCGAIVGIALTVIVESLFGESGWWSALQTTSVVILVVVTGSFLVLNPVLGEIDALASRHRRVATEQRVGVSAVNRREQRIDRIDSQMRPLLQKLVRNRSLTAGDVVWARLVEAQLRDGIRAPAFDNEPVRDAVWRARARGVSVTLLDDGGLTDFAEHDADAFLAEAIPLLCAELDALEHGEVIARVAPRGRSPIAMVTVAFRDTRRRIEFGADGRVARVVQT